MSKREMIVIGGGPAGLSAAIEAAKRGTQVLLIDQNKKAGGQLFKQIHKFFGSSTHQAGVRGIDIGTNLLTEADTLGVEVWLDSTVVGLFDNKKVAVEKRNTMGQKQLVVLQADYIVVATGASENAVTFNGWTLPGVMGAGAAQTLTNVSRVLPGKRVLMVGSGNVGLIVSYQIMQAGGDVVAIVEAAPSVGGYGVHASKVRRAGVPIYTGHTVLEARGDKCVEEAVICEVDDKWNPIAGTEKQFVVDTIAIAAGLKPLTRLPRMTGCQSRYIPALGGWVPLHDPSMQSTNPGIFVAGDVAGVEEASTALEEGRLAGVNVAAGLGHISKDEADALSCEIRVRLDGLRMGPFGKARAEGKKQCLSISS